MTCEVTAGYLRGWGKSLVPAILTAIGVCGVRISWIAFVFPKYNSFRCILVSYPVSLFITMVLMLIAVAIYRPTYRILKKQNLENK